MFSRWFYAYYSILKKITKLTESAFENQWICFEIGIALYVVWKNWP